VSRIKPRHPVKAVRRGDTIVLTFNGIEHQPLPEWTFLELMQKCMPIIQALARKEAMK
jgi:hypothetical protein